MLSSWLFWEAACLLPLWDKTVYETLGDFFFCEEDSVGLQLYRPDHAALTIPEHQALHFLLTLVGSGFK